MDKSWSFGDAVFAMEGVARERLTHYIVNAKCSPARLRPNMAAAMQDDMLEYRTVQWEIKFLQLSLNGSSIPKHCAIG